MARRTFRPAWSYPCPDCGSCGDSSSISGTCTRVTSSVPNPVPDGRRGGWWWFVLWGAVGAIALAARLLLPIDETRYL